MKPPEGAGRLAGSSGGKGDRAGVVVTHNAACIRRRDSSVPSPSRSTAAKERFLATTVATSQHAQLRHVLGCDEHQRIVDEMARFV